MSGRLVAGLENCLERLLFYFRCKGRRVLLRSEGAFGVSIDRNYSSRAWHLELKVCIVRDHIELGKCGSPEQCMIATAERDNVED